MSRRPSEAGFTLAEIVVAVALMAVVIAAIGALFVANLNTVVLDKSRSIALGVANEKMETIRDLPYDSLATQNGAIYPPGNLLDNETVTRDNFRFRVHTTIEYVDDPYDGNAAGTIPNKPKDLYPYDYKRAQIDVYLVTSGKLVATLSTTVAGKAAETSSNTGILSITVLNASGNPVPNANVTITNPNQSPAVNISTTTDNNGLVVVPKLPPDSQNRYQITASLAGYSTDGTIPDPPGAQTAVELNPNVLAQQITNVTLAIDQFATMNLHVVDTSGNPVPSLSITTTGAKKTKQNPTVFKYSQAQTTDSSGNIALSGMEWDSYSFTVPSGYHLVTSSPYAPVAVNPGSSQSVNLVVSASGSYPTISTVTPASDSTGSSTTLQITGSNLSATTVVLHLTGQTDIPCTSVSGTSSSISCSLNLSGAAAGNWDIKVTNGTGTATQTGGFSVTP